MARQETDRLGIIPTISALAEIRQVARSTVQAWMRDEGFPQEVEGGGWDAFDVGEWYGRREEARRLRAMLPSEEEMLANNADSPGLERYRLAKAQLAEMDVEERQGTLIPLVDLRLGVSVTMNHIRRGVDLCQRKFGPEVADIFDSVLTAAEAAITEHFPVPEGVVLYGEEELNGAGGSDDNGAEESAPTDR